LFVFKESNLCKCLPKHPTPVLLIFRNLPCLLKRVQIYNLYFNPQDFFWFILKVFFSSPTLKSTSIRTQNLTAFCGCKPTTFFYSNNDFLKSFLKFFPPPKTIANPFSMNSKQYPVLRVQTYNCFILLQLLFYLFFTIN